MVDYTTLSSVILPGIDQGNHTVDLELLLSNKLIIWTSQLIASGCLNNNMPYNNETKVPMPQICLENRIIIHSRSWDLKHHTKDKSEPFMTSIELAETL